MQLVAAATLGLLGAALSPLGASTLVTVNSMSTELLNVTGTTAEFRYTSGPASGGKALASQQYFLNGVATGQISNTYQSALYSLTFGSNIPTGQEVIVASLNLATAVQTAMTLNSPQFQPTPKSFSTDRGCAGGAIGPASAGFGGNCRIDPFTHSATGLPARLQSIQIGATTYTFVGGADIPTLGQINLGTLNPQFLLELASGGSITLRWTQLVTLSGSLGANLGDNMLCKDCTVYYTTTSAAGQSTRLNSVFRAIYNDPAVPEPSTWALSGAGLLFLAWRVRRRR